MRLKYKSKYILLFLLIFQLKNIYFEFIFLYLSLQSYILKIINIRFIFT